MGILRSLPLLLILMTGNVGFASERDSNAKLESLMADYWRQELEASPLGATVLGETAFNKELDHVDESALDRTVAGYDALLANLAKLPARDLSPLNRTNRQVFEWVLTRKRRQLASNWRYIPFNTTGGWHSDFAQVVALTQFEDEQDYRDYLARLRQFPRFAAENTALMRQGIAVGYVQPCSVLEGYADSISDYVASNVEDSQFFAPLRRLAEEREDGSAGLIAEAKQVIAEMVIPAYADYHRFFIQTYEPNCRQTVGLGDLPDGADLYNFFVEFYTSINTDADAVHALGLREVERIRREMQTIIDSLEFEGDFAGFLDYLRTDSQFYTDNPDGYIAKAASIAKQVDGKLPEFFAYLPRNPYGISQVPDAIAPKTTTAYYQQGAGDGSRAGQYVLNLFELSSRPLYELTALTLHEAVPGHHLQISIQQELEHLPEFRRHHYFHAYGEGWALYAEHLGEEMGIYQTPYDRFGRLVYEMWRACRLVVDSGLHAKGWSRKRAIDYMAANTALSLHNISAEVDRYISWPGQALAYKHGELKIKDLRRQAEQALGADFSLREFHALVLTTGSVPLTVLEATVHEWIESSRPNP